MATAAVRAATAASPDVLASHLPADGELRNGARYQLSLATAAQLGPLLRKAIYRLFNANMGTLAVGTSMEHRATEKRSELFHPDARYLLVLSYTSDSALSEDGVAMPGALPASGSRALRSGKRRGLDDVEVQSPEELLGYCGFRFDTEETAGPRDAEVVYCYELQLSPDTRGQGLGKVLMDELERVGRDRGMDKVMLTCLQNNTSALAFYNKQGYTPDEIDPTRVAQEEADSDEDDDGEWEHVSEDDGPAADYVILSKDLRS